MQDGESNLSLALEQLDRDIFPVPSYPEIKACLSQSEIANDNLVQECRQVGISQADLSNFWIEFQSERGLQQRERCRACPGLRRARNGVEGWPAAACSLKATEQLWEASRLHVGGRVEQPLEHPFDGSL